MISGISPNELLLLAAALLAAGAITGVLAGLFGVGGGTVAVPVLYELFRVVGVPDDARMPLCVGTSLAIIIPTSIRSFRAHRAKDAVDMGILKAWIVPVVIGVIAGSLVARHASEDVFKLVFVAIAGLSAIRILSTRGDRPVRELPGRLAMRAYGGVIGISAALMGIGGGLLSNLFMAFHGRPIRQAVATSSGLGPMIAVPGAIGYVYAGWSKATEYPEILALQPPFALGYVSLIGFILFIPTSIIAAPLGARLAHWLPPRKLELAFGFYLLAVSARFAFSLLD